MYIPAKMNEVDRAAFCLCGIFYNYKQDCVFLNGFGQ